MHLCVYVKKLKSLLHIIGYVKGSKITQLQIRILKESSTLRLFYLFYKTIFYLFSLTKIYFVSRRIVEINEHSAKLIIK